MTEPVVERKVTAPLGLLDQAHSFAALREPTGVPSRVTTPEPQPQPEKPELPAPAWSPPVPAVTQITAEAQFPAESVRASRLPAAEVWTPKHEQALLELVYGLQVFDESIAAENQQQRTSQTAALSSEALISKGPVQEYQPGPKVPLVEAPLQGVTSPGAPEGVVGAMLGEMPAEFWMNVNVELVIYGATEPTASVTLAGRPARLRPDGTFSYRFSLPDGVYDLRVQAVSKTGDMRAARLGFSRSTEMTGAVTAYPQDPALRPPVPESI